VKKVLCCIPNTGNIRIELAMQLYKWKAVYGKAFDVYSCQERPLWHARNQCVKHFLATDASYLFFVDSDAIPEELAIQKLLSHGFDKKIVHALAHERKLDLDGVIKTVPMILKKAKGPGYHILRPTGGLMEVDATGTICVMIHRSVFADLEEPYFFDRAEDFYFYEKAKAAGHKVYVDCGTVCRHITKVMI